MSNQMFRWMETASGAAKTSRWSTAANGAVPRVAWFYGPQFGRAVVTPEFTETLRHVFWQGVEAKLDDTLAINGVPLLRVTLPKKFVPHFDADGTTFYLYKAVSALVVVDFGEQWGGPVAETIRRASPMTIMGDVSRVVDPTDMPAPRAVLRAEQSCAEAARLDPVTAEVEPIVEPPPRIVARLRSDDRSREPQAHYGVRPAYPTRVPAVDDTSDASNPRAVKSAQKFFETNEADGDDGVVRPIRPKPTPPPVEREDPFAAPDAPPVNYGYVAAMSSVVVIILAGLCYAAWTFLSLD